MVGAVVTMRVRFTNDDDMNLVKEVFALNPFGWTSRWASVAKIGKKWEIRFLEAKLPAKRPLRNSFDVEWILRTRRTCAVALVPEA